MDNDFIKQIHNDKETVLCVVKGVITTSDKAEITRTANTNGSILNKVNFFSFKCNTIFLHRFFRINFSPHDEN